MPTKRLDWSLGGDVWFFTHPWNKRKLGETFTERSERSGDGKLISVTINSGVVKASTLERNIISSEDKSNYKRVEVNDIAYNSMRMWQGASGVSNYSGILSPAYTVITPKQDISSLFFSYAFKRTKMIQTFQSNSQGLTSDTWNLKFPLLKSIAVVVPSYAEQTAIGSFFRVLDDINALEQRKLNSLRELKKAYLQQMFPQNGETVPRVRFSGFSDEWTERKLGEVAEITMGQSPNSVNYTNNPNDNILVQGNADMKNARVVPRVWTTQITKTADKGDIILSVRAPVGDVGKTDYNVVLGRGVAGIKGNEFIFQTLITMKLFGYWETVSCGSTFDSINSSDLKEAVIAVPSIAEQQKIGSFFRNLDEQITMQSQKVERLQTLKKAYLQKMFV